MCGARSRAGGRWDRLEPAVAGPGLPAVHSGVWGPEAAGGAARSAGSGRPPGPPCPAPSLRGRASLGRAMTAGRVVRGQSCLGPPGFVRGRCCGLWVPHPSLPGGPGFPSLFQTFGEKGSKLRPCAPSPALHRTGSKCLNFQIFPCIPKRHLSSPVHSIIINRLFSVMHFKLRTVLPFIHRAMNGSF